MEKMLGICGLDCAACEAYQATQAEDEQAKEAVALRWREEYHAPNVDVAFVTCDGCVSASGRLCGHCPHCEIRTCGLERGVAVCVACADFDSCGRIITFLESVPVAKDNLEELRSAG